MNSAQTEPDETANALFPSPGALATCVPDHELLRRIGEGAYGEVWLARNAVGTARAVKIVRRDRHETAESFEREFKGLQKFEPVSRSHTGLVDILTLGLLPDGAGFYYVMELADAASNRCSVISNRSPVSGLAPGPLITDYSPRTLRADLKTRGALPADEVITLGLKLTAALAHLHALELVHRDVKPSNILFVGGEPKVADAGLVAAMDDARSLVGTAGYIAPEGPGTPQADLYALGKVLYEAAFGKDRQEFPALPADVASRPDHARLLELNAILLKACATDRRERYQSADQMRADLELLHAGHSVKHRQAWRRVLNQGKKFAIGVGAFAVMAVIAYWLFDWRSHPSDSSRSSQPDFTWSTNENANEEFRKGMRIFHTGVGSFGAIPNFQRATELDPNFADAYAYLARAWMASSGASNQYINASMAAYKAVSLNTNSAYGHSVLGTVKLNELDWAGADAARMRALALAPNSEDILLTSALNLAHMGRGKEALADLEKARRVAPGSASHVRPIYSGYVLAWSGQYDRALDVFNQMTNVTYWVKRQHAQAYLAREDYPNAIRLERQAALKTPGADANQVNKEFDALENAFNEGGKDEYWKRKLEFETFKTGDEHWVRMAAIHARLKEPDPAFEYLRRARQETPKNFSQGMMTNPSFESLRNDQRFRDLVAELWRKK